MAGRIAGTVAGGGDVSVIVRAERHPRCHVCRGPIETTETAVFILAPAESQGMTEWFGRSYHAGCKAVD